MTPEEIQKIAEQLQQKSIRQTYTGVDNYKTPKIEYLKKIVSMTDDKLLKECKDKIWLSAYANNNPRSDYHWHVDACYDECTRRNRKDIYEKAYKYNVQSI